MGIISDLIQFIPGKKAVAGEINSNFNTLKSGHNDQENRIYSIESNYVKKDGSVAYTDNADLGSKKIINLADGTDSKDAVNISQLDTKSSLITAGTVLNVPAQYADVNVALDYLKDKILQGSVTIQIADGTYNYSTPINIGHPQGHLITIQGNLTDRTKVQLNFTVSRGIIIAKGTECCIKYLVLNGDRNPNSYEGISNAGYCSLSQVVSKNFVIGIHSYAGGHTDVVNCLATSNTGDGMLAEMSSSMMITACQSTYNGYSGVKAYACSFVYVGENCSFTNNSQWGGGADASSRLQIANPTITINSNSLGALWSTACSTIYANGTNLSGTLSPAANTSGNANAYIYR